MGGGYLFQGPEHFEVVWGFVLPDFSSVNHERLIGFRQNSGSVLAFQMAQVFYLWTLDPKVLKARGT